MQRFRRRQKSDAYDDRRPPLFVLIGSLLLYFTLFGYDYGNGDQDEIIPYLLHRLDPGLFTQDWFVQTQVSEFSVRTYFVWLIHALAILLPVWLAVLIIYVVAWLFLAGAVYKLAYHFTENTVAAAASVVVALVLTPVWTLGGNDLVHGMLVASIPAWALGLWAVYHFLRSRYLVAPVLLGVACWLQPLVGLHLAMLLFLIRIVKYTRGERGSHTILGIIGFGLLFVLWASPSLGPLFYQQVLARPDVNPEPSLFYILAQFRLPQYYLPGSFYLHNVIRFGALALLGLAVLSWKPYRVRLTDASFLIRILTLIGGFCLVGLLFTEIIPVLFVAKLQLFKMTVLAKLLFVIILCGGVVSLLPTGFQRPFRAVLRYQRTGLIVVGVAAAAILAAVVLTDGYLHDRVEPFRRAKEPVGDVQEWAQRHTPYGAIFAIPPSLSSFRSDALRTIVVNYRGIPFEDEEMIEWFERLTDMAPIALPDRGGPDLPARLDSAFESLTARQLNALSERYRFQYVLRSTALQPPDPYFVEAFRNEGYHVYRLADVAPADTSNLPADTSNAAVDSSNVRSAGPIGATADPENAKADPNNATADLVNATADLVNATADLVNPAANPDKMPEIAGLWAGGAGKKASDANPST